MKMEMKILKIILILLQVFTLQFVEDGYVQDVIKKMK